MSKASTPRVPEPDPFLIEVAELAGLDPTRVVSSGFDVRVERSGGETVAFVTATSLVDATEVVRIAAKHGRLVPAESA